MSGPAYPVYSRFVKSLDPAGGGGGGGSSGGGGTFPLQCPPMFSNGSNLDPLFLKQLFDLLCQLVCR
jgi:hypothetical protein